MITQKYHIKEDSWLIRLDRDWITFNYELSTRLSQGCNIFGKSYKKKSIYCKQNTGSRLLQPLLI